jgi:hypothetical protein
MEMKDGASISTGCLPETIGGPAVLLVPRLLPVDDIPVFQTTLDRELAKMGL